MTKYREENYEEKSSYNVNSFELSNTAGGMQSGH